MLDSYPDAVRFLVIRLLELAKVGTPYADMPVELSDALTYARSKSMVRVTEAVRTGWTPGRTTTKKAHELRSGDVIVIKPPDRTARPDQYPYGFAVVQGAQDMPWNGVSARMVAVIGPHRRELGRDATVTIYAEMPAPMNSLPKVVLLPDGETALALHQMNVNNTDLRHLQAPERKQGRRRRKAGDPMPTAASETRPGDGSGESEELSKLAACPIRLAVVDQEVVDAFGKKIEQVISNANKQPPISEGGKPSAGSKPGYLGLIVDEARGEVRRLGKVHHNGNLKTVQFKTDSAEWHTFLVAFRAGENGATTEMWKKNYPGGQVKQSDMRKRKKAVKDKLFVLDIDLQDGCLRLLDLPPLES